MYLGGIEPGIRICFDCKNGKCMRMWKQQQNEKEVKNQMSLSMIERPRLSQ